MLNQAGDDGGAWCFRQIVNGAVTMDFAMCGEEGVFQKTLRLLHIRRGVFLEQRSDGLHRNLCRHFAHDVTTHAVRYQQQQGITREAVAHAVLIVLATADVAFLIDRESHSVIGLKVTAVN
jgi:hypothetical protein